MSDPVDLRSGGVGPTLEAVPPVEIPLVMRAVAIVRGHAVFLVLMLLAGVLRIWGLDWLPSAAADEGNWTLYALRLVNKEPVALAPDAAFVSLLYAHLIAASMKLLGFTFLAARLPGALGAMAATAVAYLTLVALGARRGALIAAAAFAIHPWSVFYSRVCFGPYALALATMTIGPLLFVAGVLRRRTLPLLSGIVVTTLGAHFSPLCVVAALACVLFCLASTNRWVFRSWPAYAALLAGLVAVGPMMHRAGRIAEGSDFSVLSDFPWRLWSYVHMVGTGLAGEATLRHFTSHAVPAWPASVLIVPVAATILAASRAPVKARGALRGFPALYMLTALVVTPLILAAGRYWHLPYNHSDRYLFALLPGFALCMAEVASVGGRLARAAMFVTLGWMSLATLRGGVAFLAQSEVDRGDYIFDGGGGYRGWFVSDHHRSTLFEIRDHVVQEAGTRGAVLLVADRVFGPMEFVMNGTGVPVMDVRRSDIPPLPVARFFFLVWPDSVLSVGSPPTATPRFVGGNTRLRLRMEVLFRQHRRVRQFLQPDGAPLLELWLAEEPRGRLAFQVAHAQHKSKNAAR